MGGALGRTVMSPQGLTILGGLAIAAYEHLKEKNAAAAAGMPPREVPPVRPGAWESTPAPGNGASCGPAASPVPPPFVPPVAPDRLPEGIPAGAGPGTAAGRGPGAPTGDERARLLITAMVSAAKADGTIDPDERARILGRLAERGAGDAERAFLDEEMARPLDIDRLVSQVGDPVLAAEVYAASILAIDPDLPVEKAYLVMLASRLSLDPGVIQELESRLDAAVD